MSFGGRGKRLSVLSHSFNCNRSVIGSDQRRGPGFDILDREAVPFEKLSGRGGSTEALHPQNVVGVLVKFDPPARFDRQNPGVRVDDRFLVLFVLLLEEIETGDGDDVGGNPHPLQEAARLEGGHQLAAAGHDGQDGVFTLLDDVGAFGHLAEIPLGLEGLELLAAEKQETYRILRELTDMILTEIESIKHDIRILITCIRRLHCNWVHDDLW